MGKSDAERAREYRARKKAAKAKSVSQQDVVSKSKFITFLHKS